MSDQPKKKVGGRRNPPGGRPPMKPEEKKVKVSITLSSNIIDWLKRQRKRTNEPMSQVIERVLTQAGNVASNVAAKNEKGDIEPPNQ